jgi:hypothetical protein
MSEPRNWKRNRERLELKLPVRVRFRETLEFEWTEITRLTDVTPFGAGFTLKRPIEKGRMLHMTIPMPRQLRLFDHAEDQYRVWALVRHLKPIVAGDKPSIFEVGVAFVGKQPPRSYLGNPTQRYEVGQVTAAEALAPIAEWTPVDIASSDKRQQSRHGIPVDILIETLNEDGKVEASEHTVTENISKQGAAVYTSLNLTVGRIIRLTSQQFKLTTFAAVRATSMGPTGVSRIHVEFIEREWPL